MRFGARKINNLMILVKAEFDPVQPPATTQQILVNVAVRQEKDHGVHLDSENVQMDGMAKGFNMPSRRCEKLWKTRFQVKAQGLGHRARENTIARAGIDCRLDYNRLVSKLQFYRQKDAFPRGIVLVAMLKGDRMQGLESYGRQLRFARDPSNHRFASTHSPAFIAGLFHTAGIQKNFTGLQVDGGPFALLGRGFGNRHLDLLPIRQWQRMGETQNTILLIGSFQLVCHPAPHCIAGVASEFN